MFNGEWMYWLSWLGVLLLIAVLVFVAWWSLFSDRARGRRRCPSCWYDMAYSPGMTCAECGFVGVRETQFHRTRRRYGIAISAIVGSVIVALLVNNRVAQRGLSGLMPTQLLLWAMPLAGDRPSASTGILGELQSRASSGAFSSDHWVSFIDRCAGGDFRVQPPSDAWIRKYGDLIVYWRQQFIGDAGLERLLMNVPPRLDVNARPSWPTDAPMTVNVTLRDWWPWGMECRIRATPRFSNGQPGTTTTFYRTGDDRFQRTAYALKLPAIADGANPISIDFEVDRRRIAGLTRAGTIDSTQVPEAWQPVHKQSITLQTRFQGLVADAFQPVRNAEMDGLIAQIFQAGVSKWQSGESPVRFHINAQMTYLPSFNDTIVGLKVELMHGRQVARRLNMWWIAGNKVASNADRNYGFEIDFEDQQLLQQVNAVDGQWSMRVIGDPGIALRAGLAPKYWSGEVTLPLRVQSSNGRNAPPRPWWTEEVTE